MEKKKGYPLMTFLEWLDKTKNIKTDWITFQQSYSSIVVNNYYTEYAESDYFRNYN